MLEMGHSMLSLAVIALLTYSHENHCASPLGMWCCIRPQEVSHEPRQKRLKLCVGPTLIGPYRASLSKASRNTTCGRWLLFLIEAVTCVAPTIPKAPTAK